MGLTSIIQNSVKAGIKALGDIPQNITYQINTGTTKDSRGVPTPAYTPHTIQATIVDYRNTEISKDGGLIAQGDRKVIIEDRLFMLNAITPKKSDQIVINGVVHEIKAFPRDPVKAVWFLQAREK